MKKILVVLCSFIFVATAASQVTVEEVLARIADQTCSPCYLKSLLKNQPSIVMDFELAGISWDQTVADARTAKEAKNDPITGKRISDVEAQKVMKQVLAEYTEAEIVRDLTKVNFLPGSYKKEQGIESKRVPCPEWFDENGATSECNYFSGQSFCPNWYEGNIVLANCMILFPPKGAQDDIQDCFDSSGTPMPSECILDEIENKCENAEIMCCDVGDPSTWSESCEDLWDTIFCDAMYGCFWDWREAWCDCIEASAYTVNCDCVTINVEEESISISANDVWKHIPGMQNVYKRIALDQIVKNRTD